MSRDHERLRSSAEPLISLRRVFPLTAGGSTLLHHTAADYDLV
jgi:hypothetical protein